MSGPTGGTAASRQTIVDVFVRRPVLAIVLSLFVLLIGVRAAFNLPIQQYPRIDASSLIITTVYVGAPADTVRGFIQWPENLPDHKPSKPPIAQIAGSANGTRRLLIAGKAIPLPARKDKIT